MPAPSASSTPAPQSGKNSGDQSRPQTTQTGNGQADDGRTDGQADGRPDGDNTQTSTTQAGSGKEQGNNEKSDDQILAEALEEFDNTKKTGKQDGTDQPAGSRTSSAGSTDDGQGPLTDAEKSKKLNQQLNEKFAKFDDMILDERESVVKTDQGDGSGRYNAEGGFGDGEGDGQDESSQTAMVDDDADTGHGGIRSDIPSDSTSAAPPDVGDGQGDDIIARQLREAAMKEQDPELRKKLWDEYRKYKEGLQAKR